MSTFAEATPPPIPDRESEPFWDACKEQRLTVKVCDSCGRGHFPPGPSCPWCMSPSVSWKPASGLGRIRTYVVFRHQFLPELASELPYTVLKVELDDYPDVVMYGRLVGARWEAAKIGLPLHVQFEKIQDGYMIPVWAPRE